MNLKTINVADLGVLGRKEEYACWPTEQVERLCLKHQLHLIRRPRTVGMVDWAQDATMDHMAVTHGKGVRCTINALGKSFDNPGRQHAILLRASLYPLFRGMFRRGGSERYCPGYNELEAFDEEVTAIVGDRIWSRLHSNVLPYGDGDLPEFWHAWPLHETYQQVFAALRAQVAKIKTEWTLVRIRYASNAEQAKDFLDVFHASPAYLAHQLEERRAEECAEFRMQAWQQQRQEAAQAAAKELAELKLKHPRYGEWDKLPKAQKTSLVWAKPMTALALEFGISGTAIRKSCYRDDVQVPPPGHWAKLRHQALVKAAATA